MIFFFNKRWKVFRNSKNSWWKKGIFWKTTWKKNSCFFFSSVRSGGNKFFNWVLWEAGRKIKNNWESCWQRDFFLSICRCWLSFPWVFLNIHKNGKNYFTKWKEFFCDHLRVVNNFVVHIFVLKSLEYRSRRKKFKKILLISRCYWLIFFLIFWRCFILRFFLN